MSTTLNSINIIKNNIMLARCFHKKPYYLATTDDGTLTRSYSLFDLVCVGVGGKTELLHE